MGTDIAPCKPAHRALCALPSVESAKICQRLLVGWSSTLRSLLALTSVRVRALLLEVSSSCMVSGWPRGMASCPRPSTTPPLWVIFGPFFPRLCTSPGHTTEEGKRADLPKAFQVSIPLPMRYNTHIDVV